ncbi:MAG: HEAT repeat domain-containing protein [Anaerolineae bacterium]
MTDNPFILDVTAVLGSLSQHNADTFKHGLAALNERGVNSYDSLFSLMRDLDTDADTLLKAYDVMYELGSKVDKRRAVFPLVNALKSPNQRIRQQAAWVLGALKSKRAVPFLVDAARNRDEERGVRIFAVIALQSIKDDRALTALTNLMMDVDEDTELRGVAVESLSYITDGRSLADFTALLRDESPDVRFWAVYAIQNIAWNCDISPALKEIDRVAAFDHVTPRHWGWHVDREALQALEMIYWNKLTDDRERAGWGVYLISPAPEYDTFQYEYRRQTEHGYETLPTPHIHAHIDPQWLALELQPHCELNVRQPKSQTYLLDWKQVTENGVLIGGLHRDGYSIVITGSTLAVENFVSWYRDVVPHKHELFLYAWADFGSEVIYSKQAEE